MGGKEEDGFFGGYAVPYCKSIGLNSLLPVIGPREGSAGIAS